MRTSVGRWLAIGAGCALLLGSVASGVLAAPSTQQSSATVQVVTNSTFGPILANGQGMTLYTLSSEANGAFTCTGSCLSVWHPLLLPAGTTAPTIGTGVTGTIGIITRPEGGTQVTYNGFPLYTFVGDSAPGNATGDGIVSFGGTWHVVKIAATPAITPTPSPTSPPQPAGPMVQVSNTTNLGPILVDSSGRTLYYNTAEKGTTLVCTGKCLGFWTPLLLSAGATTPTSGPGITGTLGSITRPDGSQQVTYNNEPLYTFSHDSKPGDTNGEGIKALGGIWHAANVNLTPLAAKPAVRLAIHITATGGTVWGKVRIRYIFRHRHVQRLCSKVACNLAVPAGVKIHLTQSPTDSSTWPFKQWKLHAAGSRTRVLKAAAPTFKITRNSTVIAVYVVGGYQGGYQP